MIAPSLPEAKNDDLEVLDSVSIMKGDLNPIYMRIIS